MKLSPYYKVFEDEAASWEEKLNRVHVLFGQSALILLLSFHLLPD